MEEAQLPYQVGDYINGEYLVQQAISGGTSEVYLCVLEAIRMPVALKTIQRRFFYDLTMWNSLKEEALIWHELGNHPHIVSCLGIETFPATDDQRPFLFLPWIESDDERGRDLREWLTYGPLHPKQALTFAIQICRALAYTQSKHQGLVHRDLKPENILIDHKGIVKVTDFGLAVVLQKIGFRQPVERTMDRARCHTTTYGNIVGTPEYMAPEQWRGEAVDPRTDIYALGCIFFELLTGNMSFLVNSQPSDDLDLYYEEWRSAHCNMQPRLLEESEETIEINRILAKCLAKSPVFRYQTASELLRSLEQAYHNLYQETVEDIQASKEDDAFAHFVRGRFYLNIGLPENAYTTLCKAINQGLQHPMIYNHRAIALQKLKRYKEALQDYKLAILLDPDFVGPLMNRGLLYIETGDDDKALTDLNKAIKLSPKMPFIYNNRSLALLRLGFHEAALDDLRYALQLSPEYTDAYASRARIYINLRDFYHALEDCDKAIGLNPEYVAAHVYRAEVLLYLHRYTEAMNAVTLAIEFGHEELHADLLRDTIVQYLKDNENNARVQQDLLSVNPENHEAINDLAIAFHRQGNYIEAIELFTNAISLNPRDASYYYNRAITYTAIGSNDLAIQDYTKAVEFNPSYAMAYFNRGNIYRRQNQLAIALVNYKFAISAKPSYGRAYLCASQVLTKLGEIEEAERYLYKAEQFSDSEDQEAVSHVRAQIESTFEKDFHLLRAFLGASSPSKMERVARQHPEVSRPQFIANMQRMLDTEISIEDRTSFIKRLKWLRKIVGAR